ncbi:unnamed protein product [Haemonchus placei]|uniref:Formimidoylglutamase n=1 Tax=Haemonchus placei TaxID=6290 RepID=A0A158QPI8_HAEPC|nr:unnamed protein product [Haemonchus placei]
MSALLFWNPVAIEVIVEYKHFPALATLEFLTSSYNSSMIFSVNVADAMGPGLGVDGNSRNVVASCELLQPLVDQVDPLQCVLVGESVGSDDDLRDKPASSRGFGLLPYLRKQKLHEGCTPQIDDFSVEKLVFQYWRPSLLIMQLVKRSILQQNVFIRLHNPYA